MSSITVCLISCGEFTEDKCRASIEQFRRRAVFKEVLYVYPQIKALWKMIEQTTTDYLIPVDSDMILNPDALDRIEQAISENQSNWHSILFPLYDTLTKRKIFALKVLKMKVMREFSFAETATPDVEHFKRLTEAGYSCISKFEEDPIGTHNVVGPKFCYHKYLDVYRTLKVYGFEWDNGVFMGGETILEKSKKHYDYFLKEWILTQNEDYLWCIAGMLDGLISETYNKSKSLKDMPEIDIRLIIDRYTAWYQSSQSLAIF